MNNKGFAITGILYTMFVMFVMILLSILAVVSYKKGILEKTILGLEDSFEYTKEVNNIKNNAYETIGGVTKTKITGKYEFDLNTNNTSIGTVKCVGYLKKGQIIPTQMDPANKTEGFTLIPNDCNKVSYTISLTPTDTGQNKIILKKVFELKG